LASVQEISQKLLKWDIYLYNLASVSSQKPPELCCHPLQMGVLKLRLDLADPDSHSYSQAPQALLQIALPAKSCKMNIRSTDI
jgi:hypothetical protein